MKAEDFQLTNSFNGQDEDLMTKLWECKEKCFDLNQLRPTQFKQRNKLLKELLGKTRDNFMIASPFWCDFGFNIEVGEYFFMNQNGVLLDSAKITFGDNAFIGPNCSFYTTTHPIDADRRNSGEEAAYPICIGDNVWIGGGVQIMPGVTIGNNVVIAGGSIVIKDIPDNVVAGGYPCRVIREITQEDKINPL